MTMQVTMDSRQLQDLNKIMREVLPEVIGRKGFPQNPVRTAVRKMAKVAEEAARADAPVDTGNLQAAITYKIMGAKYRDRATRGGSSREAYFVGAASGKSAPRDGYYLPWVELGTARSPGRPFLRRALERSAGAAMGVFSQSLAADLNRIVTKLRAQSAAP